MFQSLGIIVFENETMCAKENLVTEDTTNIFNFLFNREEDHFKTGKQPTNLSTLLLMWSTF